jgi:signal transduction histidine kinase
VFTSAAAITGTMVQRLVGETRRRAELLEQQASSLEHASSELAAQNERLQEVDRLKDDFIAVLSHELRTPLTSISGYLELALIAEEHPIPAKPREQLSIALRNVERLKALVNQILFLARIEAHPSLERHPIDLAALAREAADTARVSAETKTINLRVETDPPPLPVLGDRTQISQLLDNLVSNAVKFTPAGGRIHVCVHRNGDHVITRVTDNGNGIPPDELPHVFERFYRSRSAATQAIPGSGLGLAISRQIAEAHGTTIKVTSSPSQGTKFSFALPISMSNDRERLQKPHSL